jgi:ribosomal-protein-alanine N-acetyltransferase
LSDDLDRIMAVMAAAFDPAFAEAWSRRQVGDALVLPNTGYLLAGADGAEPAAGEPAAGFLMWRGAAGEEELLLIAVQPDHRGNGIGGALMRRFIAAAAGRGSDRLFLEMREGNPADRLYRRFGFRPVGRRRDYYRGARNGPLDAITYVRKD